MTPEDAEKWLEEPTPEGRGALADAVGPWRNRLRTVLAAWRADRKAHADYVTQVEGYATRIEAGVDRVAENVKKTPTVRAVNFSWVTPWFAGWLFTMAYRVTLHPGVALYTGSWLNQAWQFILGYVFWPATLAITLAGR